MSKLHLYHISFLDSLLKGLKANGVSLDKISQKSFIKRFDLSNPDTYLPRELTYELFNKVKYSQGIDCISGEFYGGFKFTELSDYGQYVSTCPDLLSVLLNAIKYEPLIQTNSKANLTIEGPKCWLSVKHLDGPSEGREISAQINLAMMFTAIRVVLGNTWVPYDVHITSADAAWVESIAGTRNFNIKTNCKDVALSFNSGDLFTKNKYYSNKHSLNNWEADSVKEITLKVFDSLQGNYLPTLDEFSQYFGYSKRTLNRHYAKAQVQYGEIVDKRRYEQATNLLQCSNLNIREMSETLGYATTSNFIRAFRRWTKQTPEAYRNMHIAG